MTYSVSSSSINNVVIQSLDGEKQLDITNSILFIDYFEDILSPCITMIIQVKNSSSLFNILPIRGGERVAISVTTFFGEFELDEEYAMYVYKVAGITQTTTSESFTLYLVSREGLTNETSRCQKKYTGNIKNTVEDILSNVLSTEKFEASNIEQTLNNYSFIGNQKKPFHILTWLGPKAIPTTSSRTGGTPGDTTDGEARGIAGFLFYENKEGFNFKSVDSLVSGTSSSSSSDSTQIQKYFYTEINESSRAVNEFKILNYSFDKNIDLMKALRVGMYANRTYFYDLYQNKLDVYGYFLKDQINNKLGTDDSIAVSDEFGSSISRIMFRTADTGVLDNQGVSTQSGRDVADMAKSFSRYNILFTQALNMVIPCNVTLKAGDIIEVEVPRTERTDNKQSDEQQSGKYLIKELRHHFEPAQMLTSLKLVRDSYGLYGQTS
jgi:hypothetical protein